MSCAPVTVVPPRRRSAARPQHGTLVIRFSTAGGAAPEGGEPKRGFVQKLTKSIRDFGFGKRSLVEGGVGLFVFSGIGAFFNQDFHASRVQSLHSSTAWIQVCTYFC